jgi:hypothetical protein
MTCEYFTPNAHKTVTASTKFCECEWANFNYTAGMGGAISMNYQGSLSLEGCSFINAQLTGNY